LSSAMRREAAGCWAALKFGGGVPAGVGGGGVRGSPRWREKSRRSLTEEAGEALRVDAGLSVSIAWSESVPLMVAAVTFAAEALVFEGMDVSGVATGFGYEVVEFVGGVWPGAE